MVNKDKYLTGQHMSSKVDGYVFPYPLMDNKTFCIENGYTGLSKIKFWSRIYWNYYLTDKKLRKTLAAKVCFYGPFKGEFGHFTAHTLPFLVYLHKRGVKIHYCGMALHAPFLIDEKGNSIIESFHKLRDFFGEVTPITNITVPPEDVSKEITSFKSKAETSGQPFWNIDNDYYYWFIHRNWLLKGHTDTYNLSKFYSSSNEKSCVVFPRSKGPKVSHNNGGEWDYDKVIEILSKYFDKIYVCGHPSQVLQIESRDKVELRITADNSKILEACSNASLIVTPHSGANNLGEYTDTQVLIIYNGGSTVTDIGSMNNTLRFRKSLNQKYPLKFAFNLNEIETFLAEK
jgi:ADP-heptose:LPS heptosyltransferase